ncbi:uncharacterized protein [Dysidea avara]
MKKQFLAALKQYQQLLSTITIPVIIHQVIASIARCHANLEQWSEALEYAKQSLQPPHDKDASQWILLGQIHAGLGDHYASLLTIQEAVCLERYNYHVWLALSRASMTLSSSLQQEACNDMITNCKSTYLEKSSVDIVTRTILLLKPHFKFKHDSGRPVNLMLSSSHRHDCDNGSDFAGNAVTDNDTVMWIIDQLAIAVDNSDNQVCINSLSKPNIFCQLLMILSCASCLWARSILTYCQRHSKSFHLDKVNSDMDEVQATLTSHHRTITQHLSLLVVQVYDGTLGTE